MAELFKVGDGLQTVSEEAQSRNIQIHCSLGGIEVFAHFPIGRLNAVGQTYYVFAVV